MVAEMIVKGRETMKQWTIINSDISGLWKYCQDCSDRRKLKEYDGDSQIVYKVPEYTISASASCDDCLATVEDGRE